MNFGIRKCGPPEERFWRFVIPEPNSGCWLWGGVVSKKGYPYFRAVSRQNTVLAHRFSYEMHKGKVPEGMEVDHVCKLRCCVNPDHLEAVTHLENIRRGTNQWRGVSHCVNGHEFSVGNTSFYKKDQYTGRRCKACARERAREYQSRLRCEVTG